MHSTEAATLGAGAMLLAVVVTRAVKDRLAANTGHPTSRCLRELRRYLLQIRDGHYGGLSPSLSTSLMICLAAGRPATLYGWVAGVPVRLCSCGELHEPPLTTRLPAVLPGLRAGVICGDAHGMLVPLRSDTGLLTGVLALGPGRPPHPNKAELLALTGNLLGRTLQPDEFDAARRSKDACPPHGRRPSSPHAPATDPPRAAP